jgi:hypothetical protein
MLELWLLIALIILVVVIYKPVTGAIFGMLDGHSAKVRAELVQGTGHCPAPSQQRATAPAGPPLAAPEAEHGEIPERAGLRAPPRAPESLRGVLDEQGAGTVAHGSHGTPVEGIREQVTRDDRGRAVVDRSRQAIHVGCERAGVDVVERRTDTRADRGCHDVVARVRG